MLENLSPGCVTQNTANYKTFHHVGLLQQNSEMAQEEKMYETRDGTETRFKVNMCLFLFKKMFETHTPLLLHSFLVYRKQQHPHHEIYP